MKNEEALRARTCCFTGHRRLYGDREDIRRRLQTEIISLVEQGYRYFGSGMALGFDLLAAQTVLELKGRYPVRLIAVLPCPPAAQTSLWRRSQRGTYYGILRQADKVVILAPEYSREGMLRRDRYLVDNSSFCLAYCKRSCGGAFYTVNYCQEQGVPFLLL